MNEEEEKKEEINKKKEMYDWLRRLDLLAEKIKIKHLENLITKK